MKYQSNGVNIYLTITYTINYFSTKQQESELNDKVEEIYASLKLDGKNDYQKILAIYDYVCNNVSYDHDAYEAEKNAVQKGNINGLPHSAYAALCKGKSVCQGYAVALYRLLLTAGIDCRVVSGIGQNDAHAWNIVKLNGKYYLLDSTWDAGKTSYDYFLCCEDDFNNHFLDDEYTTEDFKTTYPLAQKSFDPNDPVYIDTESDTDTTKDTDTESDTDTSTDTDTESDTDITADTDTKSDTDTTTDTDTESDTDITADTDTESDTDTTTDTDTESDTDTITDTDTESDTDTPTDTDSKDLTTVQIGDFDLDGYITSADSLHVLRISVKLEETNADTFKLADVNADGKIDSSDALEILRYSVKLPSTTKVGTEIKLFIK